MKKVTLRLDFEHYKQSHLYHCQAQVLTKTRMSRSVPDRSIKVQMSKAIFILLLMWDMKSALPVSRRPF